MSSINRCKASDDLALLHAESELGQLLARLDILEQLTERTHRDARQSRFRNDEIVLLFLEWNEPQSILLRDGIDRDAPIGTALRYGGRNRGVRFCLCAVPLWPVFTK